MWWALRVSPLFPWFSGLTTMKKFLKSEEGPTAVEYAVMLALIIVVCISAIRVIGQSTNSTFTQTGNALAPVASP